MESGVKIRGFILIGVFISSLVWTTSASAQSDFYKGKTVSVLTSKGFAERSNIGVKVGAVTRFPFVNEALRARRVV